MKDIELKKLWGYYRPFILAIEKNDPAEALAILETMGLNFPGSRWKGMVLRFVQHFGYVPENIDAMMMMAPVDAYLHDYVEWKDGNPS